MSEYGRPMTTRTGPLRSRWPAAVGALTAVFFVALLVAQAPHLVHHLFDPDHQQSECVFAAGAERTHAVEADAVTVAPAVQLQGADPLPADMAFPSLALAPSDARAPPLLSA